MDIAVNYHHPFAASAFCGCLFAALTGACSAAEPTEAAVHSDAVQAPAVLRVANRNIVAFRSLFGSMVPAQRVKAAAERVDKLDDIAYTEPVATRQFEINGEQVRLVTVGAIPMFALRRADLDPLDDETLDAAAAAAARNLGGALVALRVQREPSRLAVSAAFSVLATCGLGVALWVFARMKERLVQYLNRATRRPLEWLVVRGVDSTAQVVRMLQRLAGLGGLILSCVAMYVWAAFVLRSFPITAPMGDALANDLVQILGKVGTELAAALPGLTMMAVVFAITYSLTRVARALFAAIETGRIESARMHADTARPTCWLVTGLLWMVALGV